MSNKHAKVDFVEKVLLNEEVKARGLNGKEVSLVISAFLGSLKDAIIEINPDDRIELRGFGTFGVKTRKARTARNPRTGTEVNVPVRKAA